ncbi:MAG: hypothetical protein WC755_09290 [Candidatus Woesearchaeota archaeon]|jgi:hypothetical protein
MKQFKNKFGIISIGTKVRFQVENQDCWFGDLTGVLAYDEESKEYVIDTERSGRLEIDHYLSVYGNTIEPIKEKEPYYIEIDVWDATTGEYKGKAKYTLAELNAINNIAI